MTVKDRVGRVRHIAFRVAADGEVPRPELAEAIRAAVRARVGEDGLALARPELTAFDGREGLLRVRHTAAAEARAALVSVTAVGRRGLTVRVETLGTSGTMRAARRKWLTGEAAVRRRPRKGQTRRKGASGSLK